jgi:hypothetical protein
MEYIRYETENFSWLYLWYFVEFKMIDNRFNVVYHLLYIAFFHFLFYIYII